MDEYAVIGHPIAHSKSPLIHAEFAKQTHQVIHYDKLETPVDAFEAQVELFRKKGGKGLNVTAPFKRRAYALVSETTERASMAGAVNTIKFGDNHTSLGDNTDGAGFIQDLCQNHAFSLEGKHILILGAGGAVRGILHPLLSQSPASVVIANRTPTTSDKLIQEFKSYGNLRGTPLDLLAGKFDLIIHGISSTSIQNPLALDPRILAPNPFCYDLSYADTPTPFVKWAQSGSASRITDGIGMLVEQAALSFFLWRGVQPDTRPVIELLRGK